VVVTTGLTLKLVPEPTSDPPQLPLYQSAVQPVPTDADRVEDCPEAMDVGLAAGLVGTLGAVFTVTVTPVPQLVLSHPVVVFRARG
jgi:hypothetical protein